MTSNNSDSGRDEAEPVTIDRATMLIKLAACGIHPDSPSGRSVLLGGCELADNAGGLYVTPSSLVGAQPASARSDARPASGLDNGDLVAAAMGLPGAVQPPAPRTPNASCKSPQQLVAEAMGLSASQE